MFGESPSESPRVPSPWDSLIPTPPSPALKPPPSSSIPKLVPEAEEGNVEYKLQLLSPSPARFERLVTQLKWRLFEGGGQAYYELGVADSGALVGLPRADLEQSLETLEMMAGEIGASVIVVKEIEVPAAMAGSAGTEADRWNGKRRKKRAALLHSTSENDSTTSTTEPDTEGLSSVDVTDFDDDLAAEVHDSVPFHLRTDAPVLTLGNPLVIFSVEPESDLDADTESVSVHSTFSVDLEIASVFKPRPMRKRVYHTHAGNTLAVPSASQLKSGKHPKPKKHQRHQHSHPPHNKDMAPAITTLDEEPHCTQILHKSGKRRHARDRRREENRRACASHDHQKSAIDSVLAGDEAPAQETNMSPDTVDADLVPASLHVSVAATPLIPTNIIPDIHLEGPDPEDDVFIDRNESTAGNTVSAVSSDARLIVEALVVRKLSLEEAFLDFGGFSMM